jgi:hypothetical protein
MSVETRGRRSRQGRVSFTRSASIVAAIMLSVVIFVGREATAGSPDWIDWNGQNFLTPCQGDCSVSLSAGRQIATSMTRIMLIKHPVPPWEWRWGDAGIVDGLFSRRLVTFWHALDIETQIGVGKRFGDMKAVEFSGTLAARWTAFPWSDYVKTTIAITDGISLATQVDTVERNANSNHAGSVFLNYFSPEFTLANPQYDEL